MAASCAAAPIRRRNIVEAFDAAGEFLQGFCRSLCLQISALDASLENASFLESDHIILVGALRRLRQSLPQDAFLGTFGMFDDVVHIDLRKLPAMPGSSIVMEYEGV
jgi:hypothetical protein